MARPRKYSGELRERAVRFCFESERPIAHVAGDLGVDKERLRQWVRQGEADQGRRPELLTREGRERIGRLRRENFELRRANAILEAASVFFEPASRSRIRSRLRRARSGAAGALARSSQRARRRPSHRAVARPRGGDRRDRA